MNIGQAAKRSELSAKMIRYYEEIGLLPIPQRSDSGYRIYTEQDIKRLEFIQNARLMGFSSEQMKDLLQLWLDPQRQSLDVKVLAQQHIQLLTDKIAEMQKMVNVLQHAVNQCAGNAASECEILNQIEQGVPHESSCRTASNV